MSEQIPATATANLPLPLTRLLALARRPAPRAVADAPLSSLDFERALAEGELRVHCQPIVDLSDGSLAGFEALLRWAHPERGMLAPGEFLGAPAAAASLTSIGGFVLRAATSWLAALRRGPDPLRASLSISVNLSEPQLLDPQLEARVADALSATGLPASALHLEITETVLMENAARVVPRLRMLKRLGVELHLDDFGSGLSSLSQLSDFPVDALKIDRDFVAKMVNSSRRFNVARSVGQLARDLGMTAIAEGVETAAQLHAVRALDFSYAQGYWFAPALTPEAAAGFRLPALEAAP